MPQADFTHGRSTRRSGAVTVGVTSGSSNGAFTCDDVAATYRQLRQRGVEFSGEPQKQPWGTFATFRDPDGNQFVLSSN